MTPIDEMMRHNINLVGILDNAKIAFNRIQPEIVKKRLLEAKQQLLQLLSEIDEYQINE